MAALGIGMTQTSRQEFRQRQSKSPFNLSAFCNGSFQMRFDGGSLSRSDLLRLGAGALSLAAAGVGLPSVAAASGAGVTPDAALDRLVAGNERFVSGSLKNYEGISERRIALAGGQAPYVSFLACSDSRVSPELVFDAHVGDLFVVRNAGNFVFPDVLGTLEFGYGVLGSKLIVVLGHESCGAVDATYDAIKEHRTLPKNLDVVQKGIQDGIRSVVTSGGSKDAATIANAKAQAARIRVSPVLGPVIQAGECKVIAAEYHLASGKVTFY